jgi:methionyl aminopeptidase
MDQLEASRYAGRINREAIEAGFFVAQPGVSLLRVNEVVEHYLLEFKCVPIFKGYRGYPAACCLSPNDVVVHGVPTDYVLKAGDLLTIDVGCSYEGWCVDSARTRVIGLMDPSLFPFQARLVEAVESVLEAEVAILQSGRTLLEIAKAAEQRAAQLGVSIYPQWGGHSIGQQLHMEPFIPNCVDPGLSQIKRWQLEREYEKYKLQAGQVICLEPVVTFGKTDIIVDADGWTVRSTDGSLVAHSERCILVTETGYEILS